MSKVVNNNNMTGEEVMGFMGVSKRAVNTVTQTIQYRAYCEDCRKAGVTPMTWEVYTGSGSLTAHWTDSMSD